MKDDPVVYTIASTATLGIGMILSDSRLLLIIFLLAALIIVLIGMRKTFNNQTTKIICLALIAITSIYLLVSIIRIFV